MLLKDYNHEPKPLFQQLNIFNIYQIQSTPDNSNLQGKLKKVRVIEGKIIQKMTSRERKVGLS